MATCFCGCERRVRFRGRTANLYGGNALRLLIGVQDALDTFDLRDEPDWLTFVDEGNGWRALWARVVHGEVSVIAVDYDAWCAWRDRAAEVCKKTFAIYKQFGEAGLKSGMTPEEWATAAVSDPTVWPAGWSYEPDPEEPALDDSLVVDDHQHDDTA